MVYETFRKKVEFEPLFSRLKCLDLEILNQLLNSVQHCGFVPMKKNVVFLDVNFADEINLLITEIRRLENALQSTELPMQIARDCLGNRQRRIDTDLVQDNAEKQLLKVR